MFTNMRALIDQIIIARQLGAMHEHSRFVFLSTYAYSFSFFRSTDVAEFGRILFFFTHYLHYQKVGSTMYTVVVPTHSRLGLKI